MAWKIPKTDWSAADGVRDSDFNRIEGNILELYNAAKVRDAVTVYVSPSGNDSAGNGTASSPYATISRALRNMPSDLNGNNIIISMASGTYNEEAYIHHFFNGTITLSFTTATLSNLTISDAHVILEGSTLTIVSTSTGLLLANRAYLKSNARIQINGGANGVYVDENSQLVTSTAITMYDTSVRAITVKNGSFAYIQIIAGSGHPNGILVAEGSIMAYDVLNLLVNSGGVISATETGGRIFTGSQASNTVATAEVI